MSARGFVKASLGAVVLGGAAAALATAGGGGNEKPDRRPEQALENPGD